jgi:hypothetical protein
MDLVKKIIKDWFTGPDGVSYDVGRALWFVGILTFLGCTVYALFMGQKWDAIAYGTGLGGLLAGGGAAIGFKANSEPKEK